MSGLSNGLASFGAECVAGPDVGRGIFKQGRLLEQGGSRVLLTDRQKNTKSPIKLTCFTLCTVLLRKYASCNTHFHGRLIFLNLATIDYTSNCRRDYHTVRSATWVYFAHIRILVL